MSSITFADHKTGGRFTAAADAIAAGHLNKAAGILAELADELNVEATQTGLLAEEADDAPRPTTPPVPALEHNATQPQPLPMIGNTGPPIDMQSCARNAHFYGEPDSNGWRHCQICGVVNVAPPGDGGYDMSARQ